jgi:protoporphyrinogen/coproporphyrinogen III oxidase
VKLPEQNMSLTNIFETIRSFLTEPLWKGALTAGWKFNDFFVKKKAEMMHQTSSQDRVKLDYRDETVAECLGRIIGDKNAGPITNIISAMFHGIYGGDINKISMRHSVFEAVYHNSIHPPPAGWKWIDLKELCLRNDIADGPNGVEVVEMAEKARDYGLLMFEDGLVTLLDALVADLKDLPNVTIQTNAPVSALEHKDGKVEV